MERNTFLHGVLSIDAAGIEPHAITGSRDERFGLILSPVDDAIKFAIWGSADELLDLAAKIVATVPHPELGIFEASRSGVR